MLQPKVFVALLVVFLLFLIGSIAYRSTGRSSVLSAANFLALQQDEEGDSLEETSRLQLQDFHRVEMKGGKIAWEIRAKEAKYFAKAGVSHVNDATLTLYQEDGSTVAVDATVAKLFLNDDGLTSAELEGGITVVDNQGVKLETTRALYTAAENVIRSAEKVLIVGPNYKIDAIGFVFNLQSKDYMLQDQVHSEFLPNQDGI